MRLIARRSATIEFPHHGLHMRHIFEAIHSNFEQIGSKYHAYEIEHIWMWKITRDAITNAHRLSVELKRRVALYYYRESVGSACPCMHGAIVAAHNTAYHSMVL